MIGNLTGWTFLSLLALAGAATPAAAATGGLGGTVRDASGAAVPGARVLVVNEAKGIRRQLTTNDAGAFTVPALLPAKGYSLTVEKAGFAAWKARDIEILVGQNLELDVVLEVVESSTQVEVVATAQLVETTKHGVSQVVNSEQITDLPINGRRVDSFVLLTAAVVADGTAGLVGFRGIAGGNAFLTDGNDTTNQFYNENAGRTRITTQISQDAVQEFQVLSNGYSAEFGRALGGVVNTLTRSGTNRVHGTAYWFYRNQDFNAIDRYASFNPEERRAQFGGSLAGPIRQDRLFYFVNVEFTRRDFPLINKIVNPVFYDAGGAWIGQCGPPATPAQCAAARTVFDRQFQTVPREANSELGFARLDWRPSERSTLSASSNYLRWVSPNGVQTQAVLTDGAGVGNNANSTVRTRYARLAWTWIPALTTLNEARFGYFKDRLYDDVNPDFIPAATGRIGLTVEGQPNLGTAVDYPRLNPSEQRFQIADNLTMTAGKHTLRAGGDVSSSRDYLDVLRNRYGSYTYPTLTDFAQDYSANMPSAKRWQTFTQAFGKPVLDFVTRDYGLYIQDQFRAARRWVVHYGVRYEYSALPQPSPGNPDYPQTSRIPSPARNFAPRVAVSYALGDKTAVRGGYGIFYARFQGALLQTLFLGSGVYQPQVSLQGSTPSDRAAGPIFPNILASGQNLPRGSVDVAFASAAFRNPYTQQANLAVERQLTRSTVLTASYIFSRASSLTTVRNLNTGPAGDPVSFRINDANGNQVGTFTTPAYRRSNVVDPRYNRVYQIENGGLAWYNALAIQLRRRLSRGMQGSVAYTWSHAIDTANQGGAASALAFDSVRSTYNGDYGFDKGSSALDQRHRLVITALWQPVITRSDRPAARYLVANWQLGLLATLASAQPATAVIRVLGTPFPGAYQNGTINGLGGFNRVPFWPVSGLDIDRQYRVDARLTKVLPIRNGMRLAIHFEAFNVFNTIMNTYVNTEAYSAFSGVLSPVAGLGHGNQSQGFPDGTNARRAQVSLRFTF